MQTSLISVTPAAAGGLPVALTDFVGRLPNYTSPGDDAALTKILKGVKGMMARAMGLPDLGYSTWDMKVRQAKNRYIWSRQWPLLAVASVLDSDGNALVPDLDYSVDLQDGSVFNPAGWFVGNIIESAGWDWTIRVSGGWWLPSSTGSNTAGAPLFPDELQEAAIRQIQAMWPSQKRDPNVKSVSNEGADIRFVTAADAGVGKVDSTRADRGLLLTEVETICTTFRGPIF